MIASERSISSFVVSSITACTFSGTSGSGVSIIGSTGGAAGGGTTSVFVGSGDEFIFPIGIRRSFLPRRTHCVISNSALINREHFFIGIVPSPKRFAGTRERLTRWGFAFVVISGIVNFTCYRVGNHPATWSNLQAAQ